jgi:hypothetical protein
LRARSRRDDSHGYLNGNHIRSREQLALRGGTLAKHVFILGAGASREAGGPLMFDFLDMAEDLWRSRPDDVDVKAFKAVFAALDALRAVHAKGALDTQNVESVFSAFEMAQLFGQLGTLGAEAVASLTTQISTLISQTVEQSIRFVEREGVLAPDESFMALSNVIQSITAAGSPADVAVLTFNYDIGLEVALFGNKLQCRYRLEGEPTPRAPCIDFLKLHGSVHWTRRDDDKIERFDLTHYLETSYFAGGSRKQAGPHIVSSKLGGDPFIVPPSWSKLQYYRPIEPVWRAAAAHLCEAENVYVFGYSLPESDSFFKLLYSLGTIGTTRLRRFWLFDPDKSETGVQKRFRALLGPEAVGRFDFAGAEFSDGARLLANCWQPGKPLRKPAKQAAT